MLFSAAFPLLAAIAVSASPVPETKRGVYTLREGKPRLSIEQRAALSGQSLRSIIATDTANVIAKYEHNKQLAQAAQEGGSLDKRASATISLTDVNSEGVDELYYGTLNMGTPSQAITFDFDTGSSDLWVPTQNSNGRNDGTHFNTAKSSTYRNTGQSFSDQYGSGSCSGTLATDTVSFGSLKVSTQYFGAVTKVSTDFDNTPATGLCGLAYQSIASTGHAPLPMNLYNTGKISTPEFGFRITADTSSGAELTLGGIASDYASAAFKSTPVTSQTYYEVNTNGITVGGSVVSGSFPAAIDTGTTLIYVPTSAASAFWNAIPGTSSNDDGSYNYPCSYSGTVGFSFPNIGNLNFNLNDLYAGNNGDGTCVGAVLGQDIQDVNGNNFAIIGDVFIKSYYTVFNFGSNYVAFSPAHGST
ncbi:aspartic protease [Kockovaella imperatae]|uniref:Aspartic protease n=1 Tax=Kockovaella imperatae TaxID=4999 RepID=A0A1Y1UBW0_9TREE|nr:aspartic protease [Kockovaella imperatae]ORX35530.1 aspartic protease [Kockovaella imperatae]